MRRMITALGICLALFLSGCHVMEEDEVKKRLDYTISSYDRLPRELQEVIDRKKEQPFQITYSNRDSCFIVIGYGGQQMGKYGIQVRELYALRDGYHVRTELIGTGKGTKEGKDGIVYTPFIIIKTRRLYGKYSDQLHAISS